MFKLDQNVLILAKVSGISPAIKKDIKRVLREPISSQTIAVLLINHIAASSRRRRRNSQPKMQVERAAPFPPIRNFVSRSRLVTAGRRNVMVYI